MQRPTLILLVLALAAGAAHAEEKYTRKSGLWEFARSSGQAAEKPRIYQLCIDQSSDKATSQLIGALRSERCETSKVEPNGDKLTVDAVCTIERGRTKATTHAVITGKFDSAYTVESKSTFEPPRLGNNEETSLLKAKWLGACKPGQRPGDLLLPSGNMMNVNDTDKAPRKHSERAPYKANRNNFMAPKPTAPTPDTAAPAK